MNDFVVGNAYLIMSPFRIVRLFFRFCIIRWILYLVVLNMD